MKERIGDFRKEIPTVGISFETVVVKGSMIFDSLKNKAFVTWRNNDIRKLVKQKTSKRIHLHNSHGGNCEVH